MKRIISLLIRFVPRPYLQRVSGIGLKIVSLWLMGNKVVCAVCGGRFRHFLPYGRIRTRSNALCPKCQSLERHRLIWIYLKDHTNFFKERLQVLHVAPESCYIRDFETQHGAGYITADIESPLAKVKMDLLKIPFADNSFDVVLCNHVLEHVEDDLKALSEIYRVLKPGGWSILQIPFFKPIPEKTFSDDTITNPREREKVFGQSDHVRRYGSDYPERIATCGFQVDQESFSFGITPDECFRLGLVPEIIYVARKPK